MVVLFFISFMAVSNMMFSNIGTEKENRTIEVLMLSLSPRQMLTGKMIGLGIAGLLQALAWLAAMGAVLSIGGNTLNLPDEFVFPVPIFLWSVVFYLGGYALYTSLMAGLGALVPKIKEAGSMNMIAMSPLFLGYVVGIMAPLAELTNAALPVALSLFPLTAPVVMVMRLVDGSVPLWQVFLSAGLMYASVYFVLRAVAAMFHAQNLLSGQPFTFKRYIGALMGART
jgi:ABC-2 type transport system permease protein